MTGVEAGFSRIDARSRRQAMDWSLVLASQEIENTIDYAGDQGGWGLIVNEADLGRARESIRLYRAENRGWGWRRQAFSPGLLFDWTALLWVVLVCVFYLVIEAEPEFTNAGVMNSAKVSAGQWWRLFTAIWLHADAGHLAANATFGLLLLGLAMGRYGTGLGLLASYVAGVCGNLLVWYLALRQGSLGASGAVMGSLGLLAAPFGGSRVHTPFHTKQFIAALLGGLMLFVLFGLNPDTDIRAHAGGFVGGIVLGSALGLRPKLSVSSRWNIVAGLVFLVLVVAPWWEALIHH